ncbi:MAG: hypothetical protein AAFO91_18120, partial [Bacteroidota bacterium]
PMMTDRIHILQRKAQADQIVKFDGSDDKFESFKHQFRIQLGFRQLGYLLESRFMDAWRANSNKYAPEIAATLAPHHQYVDQIRHDNLVLFNLIGMAVANLPIAYLVTSVLESDQPQDGIGLWQELLQRYWNENESSLKKYNLLNTLGTPLERGETMEKFLTRYHKAYGQLCQLCGVTCAMAPRIDNEFKFWILAQIRDVSYNETKERIRDNAKNLTLMEVINHLQATARTCHHEAATHARRQARVAIPYPVNAADRTTSANIVRRIDPGKWKKLDNNIQKVISDLRRENAIVSKQNEILLGEMKKNNQSIPDTVTELQSKIRGRNGSPTRNHQGTTNNENSNNLPKQYSSHANL